MTDPFWLGAFALRGGGLDRGRVEGARPARRTPPTSGTRRSARPRPGSPRTRRRSPRGSTGCAATRTSTRSRCLEEATALGARGHRAAREAFAAGASELEIHQAFVRAVGCTDAELPYTTIVALDEKGATLHYESKRTRPRRARAAARRGGAGAPLRVRHHAHDDGPRLRPALRGARPRGGRPRAGAGRAPRRPGGPTSRSTSTPTAGVARILTDLRLVRVSAEEALAKGYTHPFFPHGIGHHLGIQVHDVAGRQADPSGTPAPAAEGAPLPAQHAHDRARPRLHDRARDLLHPDAAAAVPLRARRLGLRLGRRSTRSPPSAACGSRTTWW